jgi:hypothetical protein
LVAKEDTNMGEKKTTPIVVNDVEYTYEDMTPTQQALVSSNETGLCVDRHD